MQIDADWLQEKGLQRLMQGLSARGFDSFAVGGCVRNTLMGKPISDVDLASNAPPETVTDIAQNLGFRVIPTGIDHGTVTVICGDFTYEVTTFRRDIAADGRHAQVAFHADISQDAARRDFTMNAVYVAADGTLHDPVGGLPDIAARRLRFVGAPAQRIVEDYLRILRYFRFHAVYADQDQGFDADVLAAIADHLGGLDHLSKERIGQEMRKILGADNPAPALAAMAQTGVLRRVLPGADIRLLAPLVHLQSDMPPNWLARLAALGGQDVAAALRLDRRESAALGTLREEMGGMSSPAALGWHYGVSMAGDILALRAAAFGQKMPPHWPQEAQRGAQAICPVRAADFMPRLAGAELGAALARATQTWLDSDLTAQKQDLLRN